MKGSNGNLQFSTYTTRQRRKTRAAPTKHDGGSYNPTTPGGRQQATGASFQPTAPDDSPRRQPPRPSSENATMAPTPSDAPTSRPETLTLAGAQLIADAALAEARSMAAELPGICVAVVDASTHLLHFARTPGGKTTSTQTAIDKAFTAAGHRQPTAAYTKSAAFGAGGPAEGIGRTNAGRFCTIPGGVPVINERGDCIGAVGASSGTPAQDERVVAAGLQAWQRWLRADRGPRL